MPLLSIEFALFFIVFLPVYWCAASSPGVQNVLLLAASLGWICRISPVFAAVVLLYSSCIYLLSVLMATEKEGVRQFWLGCGVAAALTVLAFFKYYDFFRPMMMRYLGRSDLVDILMPLGLSYYTFQSLAYLVYCGKNPLGAKFSWQGLLLHLSFFPTVTAGPIIRASEFKSVDGMQPGALGQIQTASRREMVRPALAVCLIVSGLAKKWWFAGALAEGWVAPVFANPEQFGGWHVLLGMYGYTFQLFWDFSGYSDLVIGMAMLLGFRLPQNFSAPLRASNIRAFWDRWHISLSAWIRDYVYIPLGGSRKGFFRTQLNLMLAMVLSGIWHGYGWNFLVWGALHGAALVLLNCGDRLFGRNVLSGSRLFAPLAWLFTFHFVCFSFVVFNTADLADAFVLFSSLFNHAAWSMPSRADVLLGALLFSMIVLYPYLLRLFDACVRVLERVPMYLWFVLLLPVLLAVAVFAPSGIPGFIYANF